MTPVGEPDALARDRAALEGLIGWCRAVAAVVDDAAARIAGLAGRIAHDWPDERGREAAERAALMHRQLARDATAVTELGRSIVAMMAALATATNEEPATAPAGSRYGGRRPGDRNEGPLLGGTEGARADDARGPQIPQLPDPPPG